MLVTALLIQQFVLLFCLLLHRLVVRISLSFYDFPPVIQDHSEDKKQSKYGRTPGKLKPVCVSGEFELSG